MISDSAVLLFTQQPTRVCEKNMSPVKIWCIVLCFWTSCLWPCRGQGCSGYWEEGLPKSLYCTAIILNDAITWQLEVNGAFVNVSSCNVQGICTDYMSPAFTSKFEVEEKDGRKNHTNTVIVSNANRTENRFRCIVDSEVAGECSFKFYVRPSKPVCDQPTLTSSKTEMNITCRTEKVMPSAFQHFYRKKEDVPEGHFINDTCETYPSPKYPRYNATQCTTLVAVSGLSPKSYQFFVKMYPIILNITEALDRGAESDLTEPFILTAPSVGLSSDCPVDSYVTSGTCTCMLTNQGNPPGQARWYTQNGQVVGAENRQDGSSAFTIPSYRPSDPAPKYDCRAITLLNVSSPSTVSFWPKYAYGPNSVTIETTDNGNFDLCPEENHNTTIICKVPTGQVMPRLVFTLTINGKTVLDRRQGRIIGGDHVQDYSFRPSSGGHYVVTCKAENSASSQLFLTESIDLQVTEPPASAPVLLVSGNEPGSKVATVAVGKAIDITCKVDGGDPQVSEVSLVCGSRSKRSEGKIVALTLNVTQVVDGQLCYCAARHDSDCYDEESEVMLQVVEPGNEAPIDDQMLGFIIGGAAAGVVIVALLIISIVLCKKMRRRQAEGAAAAMTENKGGHYAQPRPSLTNTTEYLTPDDTDARVYDFIVDDNVSTVGNNRISTVSGNHTYDNPYFTGTITRYEH